MSARADVVSFDLTFPLHPALRGRGQGEGGDRLGHVTILDPAYGSGNFLYVAIRLLLDLAATSWRRCSDTATPSLTCAYAQS